MSIPEQNIDMEPSSSIIGLDVSERRIGYAVVRYDCGTPTATGTLYTPAGEDLHARVNAWKTISHTANTTAGDIQMVLIEAPWSGPNRRGSMNHAMAIGNMAGIAATRLGATVLIDTIQPAAWRRLCGLPLQGKTPILNWAKSRYPVEDQDAADALGIATAAHHIAWKGRHREGRD